MTDFELDTERRISTLESDVKSLVAEFRDFKNELRQQNQMRAEEIRDRDTKRAEEIQAIRQDMKALQQSMDSKIDGMTKHVRTLVFTSVGAIGGMFIAIAGMVGTVIYTILSK